MMKAAPLGIVVVGAALATLPLFGLPAFYESFLYLLLHWIVLATSWNILSGYAGYFSFGHGAFFGAGLYTTAVLASKFDWPFLYTLPIAAFVAALLGVGLGAIVFRVKGVRGELFALLTLAVTFVLATIVLNTPIDGGPGIYLNGVAVPSIGPTPSGTFYLLALSAAVGTLLIAWKVHVSKFGAGLFAIHDDEDAAEVIGVPTYRAKLAALAISCALAGLVGGIHALFVSYVTSSEVFSITVPLTVVLMSVLGGTRHWAGPMIGATVITCLMYSFTGGNMAVLGKAVIGLVLVASILFMPDGIFDFVRRRFFLPSTAKPVLDSESAYQLSSLLASHGQTSAMPLPVLRNTAPETLLQTHGLSKSFNGLLALDRVDINVRKGEILGLLGPNGSGKSTFINVVSGHYLPTAGQVLLSGKNVTAIAAHRIAQAGIARTYQIPRPFAHLTVLENVALAAMYGAGAAPTVAAGQIEAMKWLEFTGLSVKATALPNDLNLHQRKFLELARALAGKPELVLLDEVLCGLTPAEIQTAVAMVKRIQNQGTTIVFVEHVMAAVMALTDRIVVLNQGQVLAQGSAAEVMQRPDVMAAYLGVDHAA